MHKKNIFNFKENWQLWLMVLPLLIWLALFSYKPLYGMMIAFKDYSPFKGIAESEFVGLENFRTLMFGPSKDFFWRAFRNTIVISLSGIAFGFPVPIILAILFHELKSNNFRKSVQTATYLPYFISEVIVCSLLLTMLQLNTGFINILFEKILGLFGVSYTHIQFMAKSQYFVPIYILSGIWKDAGFASIVFFASLCGIPSELYEAAKIDGASRFKQILHISIPGIMNTIIIMLIIRVGNILKVGFEKVILLYNESIYDTADIIATYTYRLGIENSRNYGVSTAAILLNAVIGFTLVMVSNKLARAYSETSLW